MQKLTLALLIIATTAEFLTGGDHWGRWAILPRGFQYLGEILGVVAAGAVIIEGTRNRFRYVRAEYWIVFGALLVTIACGAAINDIGAGPFFAGVRNYLRAIPWFFVPAVFAFTDNQVRAQLKLLLVIGVAQVPFAIQQRLSTDAQGSFTGDFTSGTFMISSIMTIYLIGATCVVSALFVRGWLKRWQFLVLLPLLLLPTMINETKGTLLLLPVSLLVAFLAAARPGRRLRVILLLTVLVSLFGAVFFPIYEYFNARRPYGVPLEELIISPERLESYLWKHEDIGAARPAGRIDSIVVPFKRMNDDPPTLAFGFGIGNASDSALGRKFVGAQFQTYGSYLTTSMGRILLETGVFGSMLLLSLMWLIFNDCRHVCRRGEGLLPAVAAGWAGVTVLATIALFYKDIIAHASLSFVFWYLSGLIAAARMRMTAVPASK